MGVRYHVTVRFAFAIICFIRSSCLSSDICIYIPTGVQHDFHFRLCLCRFNSNTTGVMCGAETATIPDHTISSRCFSVVCVVRFLVFCVIFCPFLLFLLVITLSVVLRFTNSDFYPFLIWKLYLIKTEWR